MIPIKVTNEEIVLTMIMRFVEAEAERRDSPELDFGRWYPDVKEIYAELKRYPRAWLKPGRRMRCEIMFKEYLEIAGVEEE